MRAGHGPAAEAGQKAPPVVVVRVAAVLVRAPGAVVPVPAVLEMAAGWRVLSGGEGELATPTGMALLTALSPATDGNEGSQPLCSYMRR